MQEKQVHVVFKVINFILGSLSAQYKLLPIDKLILITLASHKGKHGIFPMQETLANELNTSRRYMRARLLYLEKIGLLSVENINKKNHYKLAFLSTIDDLQIPQKENIEDLQILHNEKSEDLQIPQQRIYRSSYRGSTDATINKVNNKLRTKREREPLSPSFSPNDENLALAREVSGKTNLSPAQLFTKFKNLQLSKQNTSAYWDGEYQNFLMNEKPSGWLVPQSGSRQQLVPSNEVRSTVPEWGIGHPSWEALHGKRQGASNGKISGNGR